MHVRLAGRGFALLVLAGLGVLALCQPPPLRPPDPTRARPPDSAHPAVSIAIPRDDTRVAEELPRLPSAKPQTPPPPPVALVNASQLDALARPVGGLEGVVLDPRGIPLVSARVLAEPVPPAHKDEVIATFTERSGRFVFPALPLGLYRCVATCPGYADGVFEVRAVESGRVTHLGRLQLERGLEVSGRVLDVDGRLCPGARVDYRRFGTPWGAHTFCDEDGRFEISGLIASSRLVLQAVEGEHSRSRPRVLEVGGLSTEVILRLEDRPLARGFVRTEDGAPLARAWIVALASGAETTRSGENGRFLLPIPLGLEACSILVCSPGLQPRRIRWERGRALEDVRLVRGAPTLDPGFALHGRVVASGGTENVMILVRSQGDDAPESLGAATLDATGRFAVNLPLSGPWELAALDLHREVLIGQRTLSLAEANGPPLEWRLDRSE